MTTSQTSGVTSTKPGAGKVWGYGLVATVLAVVLNSVVGLVLRSALDISDKFLPLSPGAIIFFTLLPGLAAIVLYLIVRRRASRPGRLFAIIVLSLAAVSLIAPLGLLGADAADWEGLTTGAALSLLPLHIIPAVVLAAVFSRLDPR